MIQIIDCSNKEKFSGELWEYWKEIAIDNAKNYSDGIYGGEIIVGDGKYCIFVVIQIENVIFLLVICFNNDSINTSMIIKSMEQEIESINNINFEYNKFIETSNVKHEEDAINYQYIFQKIKLYKKLVDFVKDRIQEVVYDKSYEADICDKIIDIINIIIDEFLNNKHDSEIEDIIYEKDTIELDIIINDKIENVNNKKRGQCQ